MDFADEIDEAWLEGVATVGVTSGASVPEILVDGSWSGSSQRGFEDVETVKTAEESITFSLPKELRRDLRAEAAARWCAQRTGTHRPRDRYTAPRASDCQSYAVT